jgi:hypothetical protein
MVYRELSKRIERSTYLDLEVVFDGALDVFRAANHAGSCTAQLIEGMKTHDDV